MTSMWAAAAAFYDRPEYSTPADLAVAATADHHNPEQRFQVPPHIRMISDRIADTIATGGRLIIGAPPRHGKSETSSIWTPIWALDDDPTRRVVLAAHTATFAASFGRRTRNLVRDHQSLLRFTVAADSRKASDWSTTQGGGMLTVGVGGALTGRGADCLIVDDPIKNSKEAQSAVYRQAQWDWWTTTARTRLQPGGSIIILLTRWHHDDIVGRLLTGQDVENADQWDVLNFPALAGEDDPLGRQPGEALWPAQFTANKLLSTKASVGPSTWAALYQQTPTTDEGAIFPRDSWARYDQPRAARQSDGTSRTLGSRSVVWQSWDLAFKGGDRSDYVVGQVWERVGADLWLLDQVRERLDFPATVRAIRAMSARWPQARLKLVEDKANGPAVMATLASRVPGLKAITPDGGKVARANAASPYVASRNVHLPSTELAPWIEDLITEAALFPAGKHDDQVDTLTQAITWAPPYVDDLADDDTDDYDTGRVRIGNDY